MPLRQSVQEVQRAAFARQTRFAQRQTDIRRSVLLQDDPGISAIEKMQFDRIADQARKVRMAGQAHTEAERGVRRLSRPALTAHIMLAGGKEDRVRLPFPSLAFDHAGHERAGTVDFEPRADGKRPGAQSRVESVA
jgi:hypothetical protein